jgi:hypothetical protein
MVARLKLKVTMFANLKSHAGMLETVRRALAMRRVRLYASSENANPLI